MPNSQDTVSPEQLAANRANAAKSTGPRTPEGKTRSAQNARKHGFTASSYAVVRLEDLQEVAHLKDDLLAVYQPVNSQELFAIERIALAQQTILRAARLESGLFTTCLNSCYDPFGEPMVLMNEELAGNGDIELTRAQNRNYPLGEGFHHMSCKSSSWSLFLRYQAQAERHGAPSGPRAVEEFERLKALREELPNEAIFEAQPEQTETTCPPSETKPVPPEDPPPAPGLSDPRPLNRSWISPARRVLWKTAKSKRATQAARPSHGLRSPVIEDVGVSQGSCAAPSAP